jgi:uncharacterized protein (DUF362 family)
MDRREFLKRTAALGIGGAALLVPRSVRSVFAAAQAHPGLAAVRGGEPGEMFDRGVAALGGMGRFVKKGQTVVIKPNMSWDVPPEGGANTNPALVERIVKRCLEAGASKVYAFDHTCDLWRRSYKNSGVEDAVSHAGGVPAPADSGGYYQKVSIAGGKVLKEVSVHELLLECDVFINVPVLKHHGGAGITMGMKNLMGTVWNRGEFHSKGLHQCIADVSLFRRPQLTVIDAYRMMTRNGPRGTSPGDLTVLKAQILSTDIVAADTAAARIFGADPAGVAYIRSAAAMGVGTMDLEALGVERIAL